MSSGTPLPTLSREPPQGVTAGRILVVDDQENMCWILDRLLSARGHTVRTASSRAAALSELERFACHVAVVDYRLPDGNGIDLITNMRVVLPTLCTILMTSYGSAELRNAAAQCGVVVYFDKPFRNDLMIRAIEESLHTMSGGSLPRGTSTL